MKQAECRSCRAWITWVVTAAGKRMPLDVEPHPDGNAWLAEDGKAHVGGEVPEEIKLRYKSHFSTCRAGKQWSGRTRAEGPRT